MGTEGLIETVGFKNTKDYTWDDEQARMQEGSEFHTEGQQRFETHGAQYDRHTGKQKTQLPQRKQRVMTKCVTAGRYSIYLPSGMTRLS